MYFTEHIRVYHNDHLSVVKLRDNSLFSFIQTLKVDEQKIYISALIQIIILQGRNEVIKKSGFITLGEKYLRLSTIDYNRNNNKKSSGPIIRSVLDPQKNSIFLDLLFEQYNDKEKLDTFRANFLEYATLFLYKNKYSKTFHEPRFRYKRKLLVPKEIPGSQCLIDVVSLRNDSGKIELVECKSNINNFIKGFKRKQESNKRKVNYMTYLTSKLEKTQISKTNPNCIAVRKCLISIIPMDQQRFLDFEVLSLKDEFRNCM